MFSRIAACVMTVGLGILAVPGAAPAEDYHVLPGLSAQGRVMLATGMVQQGQCRNGLAEISEALKALPNDETLIRLKGICETELNRNEARETILHWLKLAPQTHIERPKMLTLLAKTQASSESPEEWLPVPGGEFEMGAEGAPAGQDEAPKHKVHLDSFYIAKYEVSNKNYSVFVKATGHRAPEHEDVKLSLWRGGAMLPGTDNLPVINVSWEDAEAYCKWAGGRLPTEAEWEKAARGTDGRKYPWGNDPVTGNRTNYSIENVTFWDGPSTLAKINMYDFGRSPYGAYEMAGNVWEWVHDWYQDDYYKHSPDKSPRGPADGKERVIRGGSWRNDPDHVRSTNRSKMVPTEKRTYVGIRCAKDMPHEKAVQTESAK